MRGPQLVQHDRESHAERPFWALVVVALAWTIRRRVLAFRPGGGPDTDRFQELLIVIT